MTLVRYVTEEMSQRQRAPQVLKMFIGNHATGLGKDRPIAPPADRRPIWSV